MDTPDILALALFAVCWLGYEPMLRRLSHPNGALNTNMVVIRRAWMDNMAARDNKFFDSQLLGHALTSASFFASSNLILIAAIAGALAGGDRTWRTLHALPLVDRQVAPFMFELKLALVLAAMARSLLAFIWSIRQMNYCLAIMGAAPLAATPARTKAYGEAAADILNPALSSFNAGVRGYYFALAAGAWLLGPVPFAIATAGAVALLAWRQSTSRSAKGIRAVRLMLEAGDETG
jgi:uncharacterized membrane protein